MATVDLLFELDGPGATPKAVDSLAILRLAETGFRLVIKVAELGRFGLKLQGLDVRDKCVAVAVYPSDRDAAKLAIDRTLRIVAGQEDPPRGTTNLVDALRKDLRELPATMTASFRFGGRARRLIAPPLPKADSPYELTELRATPVRVGGHEPGAMFHCQSELAPFVLDVDEDDARKLGSALYREVDIIIEAARDVDGRIERGRVLGVTLLSDAEPIHAWRAWFAENAQEWNDVSDVRGELERSRHSD